MFVNLPYAYRATVRTHKGARKVERLFRSEGTFEVPEISAGELREAVRVSYSQLLARKTGCSHDVIFAYGDHLYRPAMPSGQPLPATELKTYLSSNSGFLSSDDSPPPLPILAREGYVKVSGYGRLPSIDEASFSEAWQIRAVLAADETERLAEAYLHYASSLLSVDGRVYVAAPEPGWHFVGTPKASYQPRPERWHPWLFALDDVDGMARSSSSSTASQIKFDAHLELFDLPGSRTDPVSMLAEAAVEHVPTLLKAAGRRAKLPGLADYVAELRHAFASASAPPPERAERVLAIAIWWWEWYGDRVARQADRRYLRHSMTALRARANAVLGREPSRDVSHLERFRGWLNRL